MMKANLMISLDLVNIPYTDNEITSGWSLYTDGGSRKKDGSPLQKGERVTKESNVASSGVVWCHNGHVLRAEGYHLEDGCTNNHGELMAIYIGLSRLVKNRSHETIIINSDSDYAINACLSKKPAKANADIVGPLRKLVSKFTGLSFNQVKGHSGNKLNSLADELCTVAIKRCLA